MAKMHELKQSVITLIEESRGVAGLSFPAEVLYPNAPLDFNKKPYMKLDFLSSVLDTQYIGGKEAQLFLFQLTFIGKVAGANVSRDIDGFVDTINKVFSPGTNVGGVAIVNSAPTQTIISPNDSGEHQVILTIALRHII